MSRIFESVVALAFWMLLICCVGVGVGLIFYGVELALGATRFAIILVVSIPIAWKWQMWAMKDRKQ